MFQASPEKNNIHLSQQKLLIVSQEFLLLLFIKRIMQNNTSKLSKMLRTLWSISLRPKLYNIQNRKTASSPMAVFLFRKYRSYVCEVNIKPFIGTELIKPL